MRYESVIQARLKRIAAFAALALALVGISIALSPCTALAQDAKTGMTAASTADSAQASTAPAAPMLRSLTSKGCSLTIKWSRGTASVTGYQVAFSPSKTMKKPTYRKVKGRAKTKLVVKGLARGKTYYVHVRALAGKAYSAWSNTKKLKLAKLKRKDLTRIITKASSLNKSTSRMKVYNSTYNLKKTKAGKRLLDYVKKLSKYNKVNIVMCDLTSGDTLTYSPTRSMYSASCLKGPYVASLNKWKPHSRNQSPSSMRSTIVWSNNDTYAGLRSRYGSSTMRKMHKYADIDTSGYATLYRSLPTRDLAKLWVGTYWYFYRDKNDNSKWARNLYTHGSNSFIYEGLRNTWKVHAKPGWIGGYGIYRVRNDAGVVMAKVNDANRPYVLAIMTSAYGSYGKLRTLVKRLDAVHTDMVKARYE